MLDVSFFTTILKALQDFLLTPPISYVFGLFVLVLTAGFVGRLINR